MWAISHREEKRGYRCVPLDVYEGEHIGEMTFLWTGQEQPRWRKQDTVNSAERWQGNEDGHTPIQASEHLLAKTLQYNYNNFCWK